MSLISSGIVAMEDMDDEKIRQSVQNGNFKQILQLLREEALGRGGAEIASATKRVLKAIPAGHEGQRAQLEVFHLMLSLLQRDDLAPDVASQLLALLHTLMPSIPVPELTRIVHHLLDIIKAGLHLRGRWLEAVPQLVCRVGSCATVCLPDGATLSGPQWKRLVLEGLCSCPWEAEWATPLARLFSALQMDDQEMAYAVDKLVRVLPRLELAEAASLVYHLLLLSDQDRIPTVLDATIGFLNDDDEANGGLQGRQQAQGTVVLHVVLAARQNLDVGRRLVRLLKEKRPAFVLSKFAMAFALALAKTDPLAEQLLQVLKGAVMLDARERVQTKGSLWVRSLCTERRDVERCVLDVADCSRCGGGWREVVQGLVRFAFLLLEGRQGTETSGRLGTGILVRTFEADPVARHAVLDALMQRLLGPADHYEETFRELVARCPRLVFREEAKLTEFLGYLWRLPWSRAARLLDTLSPLARESAPLRDAVMIQLRKAAFGRIQEARQVSASGCLVLLRNLDGASHAAVRTELLSLVGRGLSQQACIRRLLYGGLPLVVGQNPSLFAGVARLLLQQLERYLPSEEDSYPPVKMAEVVHVRADEAVLLEPLGHLALCAHRCLAAWEERGGASAEPAEPAAAELAATLEALSRRLVRAEPQDFGLDKLMDWSSTSTVGRKNALVAAQLQSLCEALMEHALVHGRWSDTQVVPALFSLFTEVEELSTAGTKKEAAVRRHPRPPPCLLGPAFVADLLRHLFLSGKESTRTKEDEDGFVRYAVTRAARLATELPDRGSAFESLDLDGSLRPRFQIARAFLEVYEQRVASGPASVTSVCIQSVGSLLSTVCQQYGGRVPTLLAVLENCHGTVVEELAEKQIRRYQSLAGRLLALPGDGRIKELAHLAGICTTLCAFVNVEGGFVRGLHSWIRDICVQQSPGDVAVCKNLLALLFTVGQQTKTCLEVLHEAAADVRLQLGTVDEEAEPSATGTYAVVCSRALPSVLGVLLEHLQAALQRVNWIVALLRARSGEAGGLGEDEATRWEVAVCRQLGYLVTICAELSRSRLPRAFARATLRQLAKLYGCLAALSKYYVALYKRKAGRLCGKVEKLVRLTGTHLTPHIYALITFLQSAEQQHPKAGRQAKLGREVTPSLIFAIEQHEKLLILLGKKAKVNLTEGCKMSTARDFRISAASVEAALQGRASETADESSPEQTETEEEAS